MRKNKEKHSKVKPKKNKKVFRKHSQINNSSTNSSSYELIFFRKKNELFDIFNTSIELFNSTKSLIDF